MRPYKRPEMELDPAKAPGQIVNRPPTAMYLRDVIARIEAYEGPDAPKRSGYPKVESTGCCHRTVIERCDDCPHK